MSFTREKALQLAQAIASQDACPLHASMSILHSIFQQACQEQDETPERLINGQTLIISHLLDTLCALMDNEAKIEGTASLIHGIITGLEKDFSFIFDTESINIPTPGDKNVH